MAQQWLNKVVQVLKAKKGGYYIKFTDNEADLNEMKSRLEAGGIIPLKSKQQELDEQLQASKIDEDRHQELSQKLSFVKFEGNMGPNRD